MSQKLPVNGFKWVKNLSRFNERFIKNYNENSDIGYFLEVDIDYPKELFNLHKDLLFLPERKKKTKKICCSYMSFKTSTKLCINSKKTTQSN